MKDARVRGQWTIPPRFQMKGLGGQSAAEPEALQTASKQPMYEVERVRLKLGRRHQEVRDANHVTVC